MAGAAIRFVHTADMHLERPLAGLDTVPTHLAEVLADAPLNAARQTLEAALREHVDFVVIAGNVLDPRKAGPRALSMLLEQFQQLEERGIHVYWAGGRTDLPQRWPASAGMPANVHVFPRNRFEEIVHFRDDQPIARVVGTSWDGDSSLPAARVENVARQGQTLGATGSADESSVGPIGDPSDAEYADLPVIMVAHGELEKSVRIGRATYWALGGRSDAKTMTHKPATVNYCGSPQGTAARQTGPHGCSLVHIDEHRMVRLQLIPTDTVRWVRQRISLGAEVGAEDAYQLFADRMRTMLSDAGSRVLLVAWEVEGLQQWSRRGRQGLVDPDQVLQRLRDQFGAGQPAAWSLSVDTTGPAAVPPDWFDEDTILGDFLRAVRQHQQDPSLELDIGSMLSERHQAGMLGAAVQLEDLEQRERVLNDAARLGSRLLRGEADDSVDAERQT